MSSIKTGCIYGPIVEASTDACDASEIPLVILVQEIMVMRIAHSTDMATAVLENVHGDYLILRVRYGRSRLAIKS